MTVKELIDELSKYDENMEVCTWHEDFREKCDNMYLQEMYVNDSFNDVPYSSFEALRSTICVEMGLYEDSQRAQDEFKTIRHICCITVM